MRIHPFLGVDGPIGFAHRGAGEEAPENTLPAFQITVDLGFRYLETDAHLTRDGALVAFHDPHLDRVTDRHGAIADHSLAEVRAADAGYAYSPDGGRTFPFRSRGMTVPELEELLTRWPEHRINIDPKSDPCVPPLAELIERHGAWDRVAFGSFSDRRLHRIRALSGGRACTSMGPRAIAVALAAARAGRLPRQRADCIQVPEGHGRLHIVTRRFVEAAHRAGLPVHVWTANDETTIDRLLDLGVDGVMTDRPRLLRDIFAARDLDIAGVAAG